MSANAPLGRGAGGVHHWWSQRVSSVLLVPLGAWFVIALLALPDRSYATVHAWLAEPRQAVLMLLLVPLTAQHAWLGVSVVIEDYVHDHALKTAGLLLAQLLHLLVGVAALFAVLKIALGSAP